MNWEPLSEVRIAGTPNLQTHVEMKALGFRGDGGERNGLQPPGGSVNHCQEVAITLTGGQGSHQIQMDARESFRTGILGREDFMLDWILLC